MGVLLALGRHQVGDDLVPGFVPVELLGQPADEGVGLESLVVVRIALDQDVGPDFGQVPAKFGAGQQLVDHFRALVRIGTVEEGPGPVGRRDVASQVERGTAQELSIVGQGRGRDVLAGQFLVQVLIDQAGQVGGRPGLPERHHARGLVIARPGDRWESRLLGLRRQGIGREIVFLAGGWRLRAGNVVRSNWGPFCGRIAGEEEGAEGGRDQGNHEHDDGLASPAGEQAGCLRRRERGR